MDNQSPNYENIELLYVVSLDPSERVYCQHPGCNRTVYAKVHITRLNNKISFVGSTCFKKLFGHLALSPSIKGGTGMPLSTEERQRLVDNTESFLQTIKKAHDEEVAAHQAHLESVQHTAISRWQPQTPLFQPAMPEHSSFRSNRTTPPSKAKLRPVYGCFQCASGPNQPYEFRSPDRICPRCGSTNNFTWRQE